MSNYSGFMTSTQICVLVEQTVSVSNTEQAAITKNSHNAQSKHKDALSAELTS